MEVEARPSLGVAAAVTFHHHFAIVVDNGERAKTGSLAGLRPVYKRFVPNGSWCKLRASVRGARVEVRLNGMKVVDYTAEAPFDPAAVVLKGPRHSFRNLRVRPVSGAGSGALPPRDDVSHRIDAAIYRGIPVADLHVHLKSGLSLEQAAAKSLRDGIPYGLAVNCGKGFPTETDDAARAYFDSIKGQPVFVAMQAEGREWTEMFSHEVIRRFDYVFTDSMTWTDNRGRRMRTWIPEEVGPIPDPQEFMDVLVTRAVGILCEEPINIYANPTYLPDAIAKDYETLWTDARRKRVIDAAVKNGIAIEINNRYKLPSASFIKMAKASGAKFTFGSNNTGPQDLGRCEYGLQMIEECRLEPRDFWIP